MRGRTGGPPVEFIHAWNPNDPAVLIGSSALFWGFDLQKSRSNWGVSKKKGYPKMDGENNGKPRFFDG